MHDAANNHETGAQFDAFVHDVLGAHGEKWAIVNKGLQPTRMTFRVRVDQTSLVLA